MVPESVIGRLTGVLTILAGFLGTSILIPLMQMKVRPLTKPIGGTFASRKVKWNDAYFTQLVKALLDGSHVSSHSDFYLD